MTHFKTGAKYSGRIGDVIAVLLPSMQPAHHYVRLVSWNGNETHVDIVPTPVFSDDIPAFLRDKGFDVNQARWREYMDAAA